MEPAASSRTRSDLRAMVGDALAFSLMVGAGETYLPAFVLAAGFGDIAAGWVATWPMVAGAVLQLATPWGVRRLGSYRRWVVGCARLQALTFVPLVGFGLAGWVGIEWVLVIASAYWGFGMATSPAWNAWVGALVPLGERARFFARRARLAQSALLLGVVGAGLLLDALHVERRPLVGFGLLFAVAGIARWVSASQLARQSEPEGLVASHRPVSPARAWVHLRHGEGARLLGYLLGVQVAVYVAAPFFTPYMLGPLGLSYSGFMTLTAAAFLARILVLPLLGPLAHRYGTRRILRAGALGVVPLPALWLVSDSFPYLLGVQIVAGSAWAALEYATQLSFFETLDERDRASTLTVFNLLNTLAMGVGCALGSVLLHTGGEGGGYGLLFLVSAGSRLLPLVLLPRATTPEIPESEVALRVIAVRPSAGAIQRPVLAALEGAEADEREGAGVAGPS